MKQLPFLLLFCYLFISQTSYAQYTNNIWCLGDSVGIDFSNHVTFQSGIKTKSGSSTISDSLGNLLFYCYGYDYYLEQQAYFRSGIVKNKNHQTMQNGDSLTAEWYHDITIIPKSVTDSTFYIFCAGVSRDYGLYYSIVDLKQNNGLGAVVQKNIQLDTFPVCDGITAIKHGNGNDWWLIFQKASRSAADSSDEYFIYPVDSSGIGTKITQHIGGYRIDDGGDLSFNFIGSQMIYTSWRGLIEVFDFDRNTANISNPIIIEPGLYSNPFPYYFSAVFSPNGRYLYVTSNQSVNHQSSILYQYDLTASNISASRILIGSFSYPTAMCEMEVGPDKRIYISGYEIQYGYPYPDTLHTNVTDNLSVINSPDSLGFACDFQPFSFYLGGNRGAIGLPNNPDYALGPLDTITAIHEIKNIVQEQNTLKIFYHQQWDIAFINADKLKGKKYAFTVFDITGKLIFKEEGNLTSQYFTKDLSMQSFAQGVYIVKLQTEKEKLSTKFVK